MINQKYGPTFAAELIASGVGGLPFSWDSAGDFQFDDSVTHEQRVTIENVAAAHNPAALPDPKITIKAQILELESKAHRAVRDSLAALVKQQPVNPADAAKIEEISAAIAALRAQL